MGAVRGLVRGSGDVARVDNEPCADVLCARYEAFRARCLIHAFEYREQRYVVDPVSGLLFKPDAAAYVAAQALCSPTAVGGELQKRLDTVGRDRAESFIDDLEKLEREGLFSRDSLSAVEMHKKAVRAFMAHHPRKMMLTVSQTCNLRCVYCYAIEGNFADTGRKMSLETAQAALRFLVQRSGRRRNLTVTLFGGEPLMNFGIIRRLVPWAKEWAAGIGKRIHFCITTNGTLLSDEVIDFLIEHQFSVLISLDGPKVVQDQNRPDTRGRGSFDKAAPRIRRFLKKHPCPEGVKVRATMTHQHHDVRKLAEFFAEFGFQRIGLGANVGFAFGKGPFDLTAEDRADLYDANDEILDEYGLDFIRSYEHHPYNPLVGSLLHVHEFRNETGPRVRIPCGVGRNDQGVDVDGRLYPCHRYVGMENFIIGDVHSGVDEQKLEEYYKQVLSAHTHCESCWATRWCAGQCPHYLSHTSGEVHSPDAPTCDVIRRGTERSLALYEQLSAGGLDWERLERDVGE